MFYYVRSFHFEYSCLLNSINMRTRPFFLERLQVFCEFRARNVSEELFVDTVLPDRIFYMQKIAVSASRLSRGGKGGKEWKKFCLMRNYFCVI